MNKSDFELCTFLDAEEVKTADLDFRIHLHFGRMASSDVSLVSSMLQLLICTTKILEDYPTCCVNVQRPEEVVR